MFEQSTVIATFCIYTTLLFLVALWVERRARVGIDIGNNPVVYSLSLAVYCSTWTYYGSVGKAATSGMLFLTIYLGPTIAAVVWWLVLRKMIRIKNLCRITSIADFISARYDKSRAIGALVTVIGIVGIAPYVAIQLKAVIATFDLLTFAGQTGTNAVDVGWIIVGLMIVFTIIFGVRRQDPTERHQGMMVALAIECLVKLAAFLSVGIFVTFFIFDGFDDLLGRIPELPSLNTYDTNEENIAYYMTWTTYLVLATSAILFLPRQFHAAVIENFRERHVRTAMWLFPLYLFLINIFVLPLAVAGLVQGLPVTGGDTFVLDLPMMAGNRYLSLLVFLGGFSAATGMVMISSMTMATMVVNHLLLPLLDWLPPLGFLRRYLLQCRWLAVAGYIVASYVFARITGESYMLVNMGMISFAAALQFAPAIIGGLFWRKGNRSGAMLGLGAGFGIWAYTLLLPTFAHSGWLSGDIMAQGPWSIGLLRPESLLGLTGLDPLSHGVFWSMFFNVGGYVLGSLAAAGRATAPDAMANLFVDALEAGSTAQQPVREQFIALAAKKTQIERLLGQYFPSVRAKNILLEILATLGLRERENISIVELIELHKEIERVLAGSIGAAAAYHAVHRELALAPAEERALSDTYAEILASLKLTPGDLRDKIDFYQERHDLLTLQARELERKVTELNSEIEERYRTEQALRESEGKYRTLVDNLNVGVFRNTVGEGRILQTNPAMAKIFGYESVEEFSRIIVQDLYQHGEDRQQFLDELCAHGYVKDRVMAMKKRDGTPIWVSVTAVGSFDTEGNLQYSDGVLEDITEQKRLEEQLRHAQKMEAVGTLTGGIAHDFNNILTAIMGYANLLKLKTGGNSTIAGYVEQILLSSEKAANLTRSLLTFSRKQVIDPRPIDLNEVVRGVENLLLRLIGEDIEFRTAMAPGELVVMADSGQMEQILLNLATNARDAMPDGGRLTIATGLVELRDSGNGSPEHLAPGSYAVITVADSGVGMDEETRQRIFEPFFTTKEIGRGTGLGLSIVYGIIRQHQGDIRVASEPGKGTTLKIYLPCVELAGESRSRETPGKLIGGNETILVAEDDESVRDLMGSILRQFGYRVIEAVNGVDAVEQFTLHRDDIALLILDVVMPKMNGRECLEAIRAKGGTVPVIFASGYTADIIESKGIQQEGAQFLQKPVQVEAMLAVIRRSLDAVGASRGSSAVSQ